ncbi:hypothetical protein GALMADRAFT_150356 [Galerina marginata CBS 339.88]|uniref:Uncharacterized protein n=1 Tax=Galerina marginata (strain CBS 339.88) TaxID=685588 RepID=A0A067TUM3_GALM3|nr:hypothetical protein GALMADRAFT_150356 [Galerina marginata CBS 339.88]
MDLGDNITDESTATGRMCIACGHLPQSYSLYGLFDDYQQCRISNGESCGVCNKFKHLESQILEAKRTLDELVSQYQDLKTQRNHIHDPITSRIPPEVVSYIFQLCLPSPPSKSDPLHDLDMEEGPSPLKFGAVCRDWRKVAWATPRLWTVLRFCISVPSFRARCDLAQQWLARSGGLPLTIYIFTPFLSNSSPSPVVVSSFIKLVNQYSSRWYQLRLNVPTSLLLQFCGDSTSHSTLHTLHIHPDDRPQSHSIRRFSLNNVKPSPANVFISSLSFSAVDIEWNNVTQVEFGGLQLDECFELLKRAPKLVCCKFHNSLMSQSDQERFPVPEYTITHHQIRVFNLSYPFDSDVVSFLCDKVCFPALVDLSCEMPCFLPTESLVAFFKRSSCLIEDLFLYDALFHDDDNLIDLLRAIPSLQRLKIVPNMWGDYSPDHLFDLLARTSIANNDDGTFLPKLQSFSYSMEQPGIGWNHLPNIFGPLWELDNPRRRPLNSVHIRLDRDEENREPLKYIEKDILLHLLSILEAGLDLTITYLEEDRDFIKASVEYRGMADDDEDDSSSDEGHMSSEE